MSVVREGRLIFAVGDVTAVSLGDTARVSLPHDLIRAAEEAFQGRDPQFHLLEKPVQVEVDGLTRILYRGRLRMGAYNVWIEHGAFPGMPGEGPCLAISLAQECPDGPAIASAQLMDYPDPLEIIRWESAAPG
jgi:hypothetical protein